MGRNISPWITTLLFMVIVCFLFLNIAVFPESMYRIRLMFEILGGGFIASGIMYFVFKRRTERVVHAKKAHYVWNGQTFVEKEHSS